MLFTWTLNKNVIFLKSALNESGSRDVLYDISELQICKTTLSLALKLAATQKDIES